ncbi:MAG: lipoprotein [Gammaproteobacteria bacterium]|tara:strand:+ start:237 stop:395 length:159 start_codon:yes stop_codon:yes gene_type:complete
MNMQRKNLLSKIFIFTLFISLISCGQTGELYLPDENEDLGINAAENPLNSNE